MRVVQIIDSLEAGGAERMAVNLANALVGKIDLSGIIATRKEGVLKKQINSGVSYFSLEKKQKIDLKAVFRLRKYLVANQIDIIHAHSSSFFIAVLVKLTLPKIKIVWHDHYGSRAEESKDKSRILILLSGFFSSVFVVNLQLQEWNKKHLKCPKVIFIPNFATFQNQSTQVTQLKGADGKRIVFLANLKNPKNHIFILKAFKDLKLNELGWSLHLIGRDYFDSYSDNIKQFIKTHSLENDIHLYEAKSDIKYILSQASIGVLASTNEGFPVTLLEYGLEKLAVASTNVGHCPVIIRNNVDGLLFNPYSDSEVQEQLKTLTEDQSLREKLGNSLNQSVLENYSEKVVIEKLILAYKNA